MRLRTVDWLTKTFVLGDVFLFCVQGGAAGLMVAGNNVGLGGSVVVAGLLIQTAIFGFFCTADVFRCRYQGCSVGEHTQSLNMLYGISTLIMVRSIFRVAEFSLVRRAIPSRVDTLRV